MVDGGPSSDLPVAAAHDQFRDYGDARRALPRVGRTFSKYDPPLTHPRFLSVQKRSKAFLTRGLLAELAHGAFVSGPCSGTAHFFCMLLLLPSRTCTGGVQSGTSFLFPGKCDSNATYLQRQALTPRTIHYGHTRIRPIRRTRACSLVGREARR